MGQAVTGKLHAHKKQACGRIVVLGGFFNVAATLHQEARYGVYDAHSVRAGQGKNVGVGHRANILAGGTLASQISHNPARMQS